MTREKWLIFCMRAGIGENMKSPKWHFLIETPLLWLLAKVGGVGEEIFAFRPIFRQLFDRIGSPFQLTFCRALEAWYTCQKWSLIKFYQNRDFEKIFPAKNFICPKKLFYCDFFGQIDKEENDCRVKIGLQ